MKIDAIVLAGGNARGLDDSVSCKGLVPICDRPMVEYVVDALRACPSISRVVAVLPDAGTGGWQRKVDAVVMNYGSVVENFLAGVDELPDAERVLVMSGDVPLMTADAIEHYLGKCEPFDADLYYPITSKDSVEARFPGVQRTYMHMRGGTYTGGNIGLVNPTVINANRDLMQSVFDARKSPLKLLRLIGLGFVVKFLLRRLTIPELERKVSQIIGGKGRAIIVEYPEIGFDVDKPSDLALATRLLAGETC